MMSKASAPPAAPPPGPILVLQDASRASHAALDAAVDGQRIAYSFSVRTLREERGCELVVSRQSRLLQDTQAESLLEALTLPVIVSA